MARKIRAGKLKRSASRLNPRSEKVRYTKWKITLCILLVLVAVVCAYESVRYFRTEHVDGGVEVIVGNALMARIDPKDVEEDMYLLHALEEVSVRPTSNQILVLTGPSLDVELGKVDAEELCLHADGQSILLRDEHGEYMGVIERVYIPVDE